MNKQTLTERLTKIAEQSNTANGEVYTATAKDWENNGKSRTYFKVSRTWRNKYQAIDYGYIDNTTGEYVKGLKDLSKDVVYDFGGNNVIKF